VRFAGTGLLAPLEGAPRWRSAKKRLLARALRHLHLVTVLALSACTVGPEFVAPSTIGTPARFVGAADADATGDLAQWWQVFGDAQLSALVTTATADNLDIAQAAARLVQAREGLVQAGAVRLPSATTSGSAVRNIIEPGPDSSNFGLSVDAQWNADLFGGLRRGQQSSRAALAAAGYNLADVRTAVAAEVARNYVSQRTFATRIAITEETVRTQRDNFEIAGFRAQAGLVSSLDVEQARAQLAQTLASIPPLRQQEAAARYRIAVLTGQAPGAVDGVFTIAQPIPRAPDTLAAGVPLDVLRQRPDIRAAEANLAAATAQIGVAQAQLYPALTLGGSVGTQAGALRTLADVVTGNLFAQLTTTIFDAGRLRSVVRQRRAQTDESLAAYRARVLGAFEDVENALAARESAGGRAVALTEQVSAATAAAVLARSNYRAGLTDFRTLLDIERTLLQARDGLAAAQGDRASAAIQLYLALGGGWTPGVDDVAQPRDPQIGRR